MPSAVASVSPFGVFFDCDGCCFNCCCGCSTNFDCRIDMLHVTVSGLAICFVNATKLLFALNISSRAAQFVSLSVRSILPRIAFKACWISFNALLFIHLFSNSYTVVGKNHHPTASAFICLWQRSLSSMKCLVSWAWRSVAFIQRPYCCSLPLHIANVTTPSLTLL